MIQDISVEILRHLRYEMEVQFEDKTLMVVQVQHFQAQKIRMEAIRVHYQSSELMVKLKIDHRDRFVQKKISICLKCVHLGLSQPQIKQVAQNDRSGHTVHIKVLRTQ